MNNWQGADPFLLPFLQAETEQMAQDRLAQLIYQCAVPVIRTVIKSRFQMDWHFIGQEMEDLVSSVVVHLLTDLQELKDSFHREAIRNFKGYVATVTVSICADWLRKKRPRRTRLQDQIRYALLNQPGFALWEDGKTWFCGFEDWRKMRVPAFSAQEAKRLLAGELEAIWDEPFPEDLATMKLVDLLKWVLSQVGKPLEFSLLVNLIVRLRRIQEPDAFPAKERTENEQERELASAENLAARLEDVLYLKKLWEEIRQLPLAQRMALLLNLRDGGNRGLIVSFSSLGIARLNQLAAALEMSATEFAAVWQELPWDDKRIAAQLGVERQQVINLRRAARRILARRMQRGE